MFTDLRLQTVECLREAQTTDLKGAALEIFQMIAEEWSWFYINLACLSKEFTRTILCDKLRVHKDLAVLFEMVNLISDVVKSDVKLTALILESQQEIKLQVLWAVGAIVIVD